MATDEDLIGAVAAGDTRAFEALYRRWERPVYGFIHRHTGGRDADDLAQETWVRVVGAAHRFDRSRRFSTWLFQIALNLCRDWHRRAPPAAVEHGDPADASASGVDSAATTEAGLDARRLLAALPEAQRDVVVLRYFHDCSEDETAEILGCPRGTVKSRMHHAMARLLALARAAEPSDIPAPGGAAGMSVPPTAERSR
jgi:RNA polymerase sigma-70 factor (ECF subfamily)